MSTPYCVRERSNADSPRTGALVRVRGTVSARHRLLAHGYLFLLLEALTVAIDAREHVRALLRNFRVVWEELRCYLQKRDNVRESFYSTDSRKFTLCRAKYFKQKDCSDVPDLSS